MYAMARSSRARAPPQIHGRFPQGEPRMQPNQGSQQVPPSQLVGLQQILPEHIPQSSHAYDFHQPPRIPAETPISRPLSSGNATPAILITPLEEFSPSYSGINVPSSIVLRAQIQLTSPQLLQNFSIPDLDGVTPEAPLPLPLHTSAIPPPISLPAHRYSGAQNHLQVVAVGTQHRLATLEVPHQQTPPNAQYPQGGPRAQHREDSTDQQNQQNIIEAENQRNRQQWRSEPSTQHRQDSGDTQNRPDGFDANRSESIHDHSADHCRQELDATTREVCGTAIAHMSLAVSNPPVDFIKIAQEHPHIKYNGFSIEHGLLEIGRKFGAPVLNKIMLGVIGPIRISHAYEDLSNIFDDLDKERFQRKEPMTLDEAIAPGTIVLAVSYRHHPQKKEGRPSQKMADRQKADLLQALVEIFDRQKPQRILLWIDQAWTQRIGFSRKKWLGSGILAYFAFNVLLLEWENDPDGLWLYLERKIANTDSTVINLTQNATLFERCFEEELANNIMLVARTCTGDSLNGKRGRPSDIHYVRDFAEVLQESYGREQPSQALSRPRNHNTTISEILLFPDNNLETSFAMKIDRHMASQEYIIWYENDMSTPWSNHAWSGVVELMGNKNQTLPQTKRSQLQEFLELLGSRYLFKVFSFRQSDGAPKYVAIGKYLRFCDGWRIILCDLSGCENSRGTFVTATCLLNANSFSVSALQFLCAFNRLTAEFWETVADKEAYLKDLLDWKWLSTALQARGFDTLHDYRGTIQAKDVKFSVCFDQ